MTQIEVSRWGHFLACATDPLAGACADFASHCQRTRIARNVAVALKEEPHGTISR
jgi:hypothetical protein